MAGSRLAYAAAPAKNRPPLPVERSGTAPAVSVPAQARWSALELGLGGLSLALAVLFPVYFVRRSGSARGFNAE